MRAALGFEQYDVGVILVSDACMARWNLMYRGCTGPTDVLSFPHRQVFEGDDAIFRPGNEEAFSPSVPSSSTTGGWEPLEDAPHSHKELGDIALDIAYIRRTARMDGVSLASRLPVS